MRVVSFDVWGTLLHSNPEFKASQNRLAKRLAGLDAENFLRKKEELKIRMDKLVEESGIQPNRVELYQELFPKLSLKEIDSFIYHSDILFLKHPPIVIEKGLRVMNKYWKQGYTPLISSNTVFIHGNMLSKVLFDEFDIPSTMCNFSDEKGVSKPNEIMFQFKYKPEFHVGDNPITDGACEQLGIKFINIKDANI